MDILLLGVSNVGKSSIGELLAKKIHYDYYDLDDIVKNDQNMTLEEFVNTGTLFERDQLRCNLLNALHYTSGNKVVAVTPISYIDGIKSLFNSQDVLSIYLYDSVENIFDRLVFSDENDVIYNDDEYKMQHMDHYIKDISADLDWYGSVYGMIKNRFNISGNSIDEACSRIIEEYHLEVKGR